MAESSFGAFTPPESHAMQRLHNWDGTDPVTQFYTGGRPINVEENSIGTPLEDQTARLTFGFALRNNDSTD
jgi:hypothetical protein